MRQAWRVSQAVDAPSELLSATDPYIQNGEYEGLNLRRLLPRRTHDRNTLRHHDLVARLRV
jgi:hypothetical protein